MILASEPGFDFADPVSLGILFVGIAVFAAIGALSHQHDRAFSAALIYLALGLGAAAVLGALDVSWLDPLRDREFLEHAAEFALVIALFSTGLSIDRRLTWRGWTPVVRLLAIVMPLTILAAALLGTSAMGLSVAAAVGLAATLAPTDPVLAGDIGVGPPGEEDERDANVAVTAEAGLNDGLAMPFVLLAFTIAAGPGTAHGSLWDWFAADVVYAVAGGVAIGAVSGWCLAAAVVPLRDRKLLSVELDRWIALAAVLVIYGATEAAGGYGFVAAFVGGLSFRRYERDHEVNARVHEGASTLERLAELGVILLLGTMVSLEGLQAPGWTGWLLIVLLLLVIRPLAVLAAFVGSRLALSDRLFLGWFGVRGIGTLYYAAFLIGSPLGRTAEATIMWTAIAAVLVSIVLHGVTGTPVTGWLLEPRARRRRARATSGAGPGMSGPTPERTRVG
jgi:NhaP-type Na+/H+ or K+/H+ antiporter